MRIGSRLIERYIIGAVLPYLFLALLLLTAILFAQQAGKFGDLLMGVQVPAGMVAELALSLLPNVLVFTLPMGLLTGILIGFSRMGTDSELVAIRSAGVGAWHLLWPLLSIGLLLTAGSLYVNMEMAPDAARSLRYVGTRAALYKLDSPVEPRSFSVIGSRDDGAADTPVYVIYVRDGDQQRGQWGRVFLHSEMKDGSTRIVTARSGRIDSGGEKSELVLSDVALTTLPGPEAWGKGEYSTERLEQSRFILETGRKKLLDSLRQGDDEARLGEMGWGALSAYAASKTGVEYREASTLLHKRLALSVSPLLFAFLGAALGMRVRKGGRGIGVLLSVLAILVYYLIMLAGEQMGRAGTVPPWLGGWLASFITLVSGAALLAMGRVNIWRGMVDYWRRKRDATAAVKQQKQPPGNVKVRLLNFPSLMDVDVLKSISLNFAMAFTSLVAIFLVFTLFELWRFIVARGIRMGTVGEYLLFLLPLVSVQLLPATVLIAMLTTYALIARRNEAIAWWASGQSGYRLMLPGLIFSVGVAACSWGLQENLMPEANVRQDVLRAQIRGGVSRATVGGGRQWLASAETERLYSYEYEDSGALKKPVVYSFDDEGVHLRGVASGRRGYWVNEDSRLELEEVVSLEFRGAGASGWKVSDKLDLGSAESWEMFKPASDKPSHLSAGALSDYIKTARKRGGSTLALEAALQKKYAGPFGVMVMALMGIPLALSFGRKSAIIALCLAIAFGLVFWAATGGFQQMGEYGILSPLVAAWSPIVIFAAMGLYLLFRART
jgi:LPS export ABC transporter permease LptG